MGQELTAPPIQSAGTSPKEHRQFGIRGAELPVSPDVISPLRVLLIEDNAIDARLIQIMLSDAGSGSFELERADRLESGLKRLAGGGGGLVLLDLLLSDSYGLLTFSPGYRGSSRGAIHRLN